MLRMDVLKFSLLLIVSAAFAALGGGCASHTAQLKNAEGVGLFQKGSYDLAIKAFEDSIRNDERNATAYYNIASVHHHIARSTKQPERFEQAKTYYLLALKEAPDYPFAYRGLAVLYVDTGHEKEAFDLLCAWEAANSGSVAPKIELARLYGEFGRMDDASNCVAAASAVSPEDARILRAFGYVREQAGDPVSALAAYHRSLGVDPNQEDIAARVAYLQTSLAKPHVWDETESDPENDTPTPQPNRVADNATTEPQR